MSALCKENYCQSAMAITCQWGAKELGYWLSNEMFHHSSLGTSSTHTQNEINLVLSMSKDIIRKNMFNYFCKGMRISLG